MTVFWNCLILLLTTCIIVTSAKVAEYNTDCLEMMQTLQNEVKNIKKENKVIRNENKELKSRITDLQDAMADMEYQKAATVDTLFLATISEEIIYISDFETITFDLAPINRGGNYNTTTGGYTAPYTGYYQFSVQKTSNEYSSLFWLVVDGKRFMYGGLYDLFTDNGPSTANTINVLLTAGQAVKVENEVSSEIYGTRVEDGAIESWFTGFMLYKL